MGKGTIQSHLGDGLYDLQLEFNKDRALAQKADLEERYDELYYDEVPELETDKDTAEQDLNAAEQDLNEAIESGDVEAISDAQEPYLEALRAYSLATQALSSAKLELETVSAKIQSLSNIAATDSLTAWCADLTTDLSGEVGTVEVPGERDHVLIRPGHDGAAAYDAARDGQIFPIKSTTPAATFYNLAMLPGWQKWRPQYRLGEITALDPDTDTCDVALDAEASSAQGLGVNQSSTLSGIPIEYMACNSAAFEVGDRVLVEFVDRDWEQARVVGFESEPVACEVRFQITLNSHECTKPQIVHIVDDEGTVHATKQTEDDGTVVFEGISNITDMYLALGYKNVDGEKVYEYYQEVAEGEHDKQVACGIRERYDDVDYSTNDCHRWTDVSPEYPWMQFVVLAGNDFEIPEYISENMYLKTVSKKLSDIKIGVFDLMEEDDKVYRVYDFDELAVTKMHKEWTHNENFTTCEWPEPGLDKTTGTSYGIDNTECFLPVLDCVSSGTYGHNSAFYRMIGVQTDPYIYVWETDEDCEEYPRSQYHTMCEVFMGCLTDDTSIEKFVCLSDADGRNITKSENSLVSNAGPLQGAMWKEKFCVDESGSAFYWGTVCNNNEVGAGPASAQYLLQVVETPVERI